ALYRTFGQTQEIFDGLVQRERFILVWFQAKIGALAVHDPQTRRRPFRQTLHLARLPVLQDQVDGADRFDPLLVFLPPPFGRGSGGEGWASQSSRGSPSPPA